jgi:multiple sugar transport system ATP-binding protein
MAEVKLRKIVKFYDDVEAVRGIDLDIADHEFVVLVGPSGCGKSTTLRMIAGLEDISGGDIMIGGHVVNDVPPKDRDMAMVFQNYALYPHMTVEQNMSFGLRLKRYPKAEIRKRVDEAARILDIKELLNRKPKQLSGGQRQRVAMGRAIVRNPKVFLFDEPLSNLDAALRVATRIEIAKLHHSMSNVTMIYVTHDQVEAMTLADRIAVLRDGKLEQAGSPAELYEHPNSLFVAGFIGSPKMNFLTGKVAADHGCTTLGARSEHIEVVDNGPWSGEVLHVEDLGSDHFLFVEIGSDEPIIVRRPGKANIAVGTTVSLAPQAGHLYRFDADGKPLR